jgi:hypothetical protein
VPVVRPTQFLLYLNIRTAKTLGESKINKKYPFKQMQPGETFKLNDADVRRAQNMAWYYRTRCKRPINIVIARRDDGYHCERVD